MIDEELNEREKSILRSIVQQFILTAAPVGSRYIVKKYDIGFSPATVRNIMSDLEESGFINHPHTSAGRVPTDKGYRFYVDSLMEIPSLNQAEKSIIKKSFSTKIEDTDDLFRLASKLMSQITSQIACVTYPKLDRGVLQKIQLVTLSSTRLLIVLSIKSGLVKTITLEIKAEIKESQLTYVESLLNERLSGLTLDEIRKSFKERFSDVSDEQKPIIRIFVDSVDKIFIDSKKDERVYITGAKHVLTQPEFENPEKFQSVIELIEDKDIIIHILEKRDKNADDVIISIGRENKNIKLDEYSFVSKEYNYGETSGTLGIIGPKRMEYSKVVAIVDYIAKMLSEMLKQDK
ncbi:MAG TPA: heat-inducible transcriptional repressor HrcA [Ignavibacteriaceae bacterium]|nr:heat-inducible transcriptional repressor HrcA [Ignavibacteriaceae bacterium]